MAGSDGDRDSRLVEKQDQLVAWRRAEEERVKFLERIKHRYPWISFPIGYIRLIELGTTDFDFWTINTNSASILRYSQEIGRAHV